MREGYMRKLILIMAAVALAGCTGKGRLYNLTTGEVTELKYKYGLSGHGRILGQFASGEKLSGEYTTVPKGAVSWGIVYGSVRAANISAFGSSTSTAMTSDSDQPGTAIITGNHGAILECEYVTSAMSGHGHGGCRDKSGTLYRMMF